MKRITRVSMIVLLVGVVMLGLVTAASAAPEAMQATPAGVEVIGAAVQAEENPVANLDLTKEIAAAGSIVLLVTGLVSLFKSMGVKGNWLTVSSLAIGVVFGLGYKYATRPAGTFAEWFAYACFGVFLGLIACGVYDAYGKSKTA